MENANVYIKVAKQDEEELLKLMKKSKLKPIKEFEGKKNVGYALYNVRWYWIHPDVQRINNFIDKTSKFLKGLIMVSETGDIVERHGKPQSIGMKLDYKCTWE